MILILNQIGLCFVCLADHALHFINAFLVVFQAILDMGLDNLQTLFSLMDILFDFSLFKETHRDLFLGSPGFFLHALPEFVNLIFQITNLRLDSRGDILLLVLNLRNYHSLLMLQRINFILPFLQFLVQFSINLFKLFFDIDFFDNHLKLLIDQFIQIFEYVFLLRF